LKRVSRSLQEAGVLFASNAITVKSGAGPETGAAVSQSITPPLAANA
jgi:hypothetical protein